MVNITHTLDEKNYKQIYINAHGNTPVSRKSITKDGHNYSKNIDKNYIGTVPAKTLLITCTPPNHYFIVDKREKIIKEIIINLILYKLDYLINLKDIDDSEYIFKFLLEIQIYEPNDIFYNQEVLFENTKINNIMELNKDNYTFLKPTTRKYYGADSLYKTQVDTRTNKEIDPILDKTNKYEHPWDCNYIPYSLNGLIHSIKKDFDNSWLVIYVFICNPRGNPNDISFSLYNKIYDIYNNGKKTCQKYREYYYFKYKIRKEKRKKIKMLLYSSLPTSIKYETPFEYDKLDLSQNDNTE